MSEPLRVLQIVTKMDRAGLETMLMNYYRHIDRDAVQFDFMVHRQEMAAYDEEILSLGGRIYRMPPISPRSFVRYQNALAGFFSKHTEYKLVHSHLDALSAPVLKAAKAAGVPVRIAHSHSNNFDRDWKLPLRKAAKQMTAKYATQFWGCSNAAVKFMFGNTPEDITRVIPNAIDTERFALSAEAREAVRRETGIPCDAFVVGNVGRFSYPKNHGFLLDIFAEVKKRRSDSVLLLVGGGELENSIRSKVNELGISDSVVFAGIRGDVPELMQAMDAFLLPSRYEGLGIVLIEAQAAGLHCVASSAVPNEVNITGKVEFISPDAPASRWAQAVLHNTERYAGADLVKAAGYDIISAAQDLQKLYLELE